MNIFMMLRQCTKDFLSTYYFVIMIIPKLLFLLAPLILVEAQFFRRYPIRRPIFRPDFRPETSVSPVVITTTEKLTDDARDVTVTPNLSATDIIAASPVKKPELTIVYPENYIPSSTVRPRPIFSSGQRQPIRGPFWTLRPGGGRPNFGRPSNIIPSTTVYPNTLRPRYPSFVSKNPSYTTRRPELGTEPSEVLSEIVAGVKEPTKGVPELSPPQPSSTPQPNGDVVIPNEISTIQPNKGEVVVPNEVSTIPPIKGEVVVPNEISTVQPNAGEVVVPNEIPTVQPNAGEVIVPNEVPTVQPNTGEIVVPNIVSTVQPNAGEVVVPNEVPTVQPNTGEIVVPNIVSTVQPNAVEVVVPNEVSTVQPNTGEVVVPNEVPTGQPNAGGILVPNEVPTVTPNTVEIVQPNEVPTVQPNIAEIVVPNVVTTSAPSFTTTTRKPITRPIETNPIPTFNVNQLQDYKCRVRNGYDSVPNHCDVFVECKNNRAFQYTCPDGLHFNPEAVWPAFPCAYPSEVKCQVNSVLQIAKPTSECPRRYGFFQSPSGDCSQYISCQEGISTKMYCPSGLAFNPVTTNCDWPVNVPGCNPDVFEGFTCPAVPVDKSGRILQHIFKYRYKNSCKNYIACQGGHPRLLSCDAGLSYDETSKNCVQSERVIDCKN